MLQFVTDIIRRADMKLLGLCMVCTAFGLVLIASATGYLNYENPGTQMKRVLIQTIGAMLGIGAYFVFSNIDMEHFAEKWWLFLVFDIGSIALLKTPLGRGEGGNHSWLYVGLPMMIQPAEIVRLTFTVLLAKQIAWFRDDRRMKGLASLIFPAAHAGFMFVWIYILSKDAGSGLMYLVIYVGMAVAAGLAWYWFALGFGVLGLGIGGLVVFDKLPQYWMDRFHVVFDHAYISANDIGWQQRRGMLALGSGGLFGQGLFQGIQTQGAKGSLPARQTDFIFCVCGEELGLVGCLAIIVLEFLLVYRCFQTARLAKSSMDALICVGFGTMLIFQVVENIGMCLFVMPVIGLTLPFFSYGGSSIVALYAAMGMVSGVRSRTLPDWLRKT
ncbi:MAG: FtsW/RodA/SpoVE family cell cycle protein [Oscillospiraceae bacterium]|nr:FtsW/RodA/SpoVE family cell cycle protein [Oscillospiraceae bacterium]MDE7042887.1 FtsW/RodA/SpoVE family cell cycle protein [Oscillospiraceae bacterium]